MISIHTLTLLAVASFVLFDNPVHGENLRDLPHVPRAGDGVTPLDEHSMVRGAPIEPETYVDARNGTAKMMRNGHVIGDADMLHSTFNDRENVEISYLENHYKLKFVTNANEILQKWPRAKTKKAPWPGSYWPTYQDSINVRWNGGPSATEKYARSCGLNVQDLVDNVSLSSGLDATQRRPSPPRPCRDHSDCQPDTDQQLVCGKREGKASGYCVATWEGVCHAWAPAAILEDEPKCAVSIDNVTFQPNDIKGLISEVYHSAQPGTLFMGLRFNGGDDDATDEYGRYVDYSRRDMSPAAFHLVCANLFGRSGKSFLLDADSGLQVWNHPVRSYEFADVETMSPNEAAQRYIRRPTYPFNQGAKMIQYVRNILSYIVEPTTYDADGELAAPAVVDRFTVTQQYEYLLELDDKNNIIGGEWVGTTRYKDHPDFLWFPVETPKNNYVTPAGISYDFVRMLIHLSREMDC